MCLQSLKHRIKLPFGFNRPYRCVVKYGKSYVMEELANLIWLGGLLAEAGPPGFRRLWGFLQPALQHYLYGWNATVEDIHAAAANMRNYAQELERGVIAGKIPSNLLSPNLHVAVCRLPDQELAYGPAACFAEWWMERYMLTPKKRSKFRTVRNPEITYLKHTEMLSRALRLCRVHHPGCMTMDELIPGRSQTGPGYDSCSSGEVDEPRCLFHGKLVTGATEAFGMCYDRVSVDGACTRHIAALVRAQTEGWTQQHALGSPWDHVRLFVYTACQLQSFIASSLTGTGRGRKLQSAYVELLVDGVPGRTVALCRWFGLMLQTGRTEAEGPVYSRFAVVQPLRRCSKVQFAGQFPVWRAQRPEVVADSSLAGLRVVSLDRIVAPLILLLPKPGDDMQRFLTFSKNSQMV